MKCLTCSILFISVTVTSIWFVLYLGIEFKSSPASIFLSFNLVIKSEALIGRSSTNSLKKGELKVTVIATNFPSDLPKKSLFSAVPAKETNQTVVKEENVQMVKKEVQSSININQGLNVNNVNTEFFKKPERKPEPEEIIIEDDSNDWSAVPAFLRRKK